jgi:transcriptional regulator with XRE-family HTH domain
MTLTELLARKMADYEYGSVAEMARDMGVSRRLLEVYMRGVPVMLGDRMRRAIIRTLDVDPEILMAFDEGAVLRDFEMETLVEYRKNKKRHERTAEALFIHVSTLTHRLNVIRRRTGKDPRIWENLRAMTEGWME